MTTKLPKVWVLTVERQIARFDATAKHLNERGVAWERFDGFDNTKTQLLPVQTFDLDRVGERIGPKHIAATLSHMAIWYVMKYQPDDMFITLEYDARLTPDFEAQYERAMRVVPEDFDVLFLGSCCCKGRPTTHIAENVYDVRYPCCGHAILYKKKALPVLIREHQTIRAPLDVALFYQSLPKLKVFTILDPIITQEGTPLPP